jgi:hypothetical protein
MTKEKESEASPRRSAVVWVALLAPALAVGCGGESKVPVYPVSGQVRVAGKTPEGAFVALHPKAQPDVKAGAAEPPRPSAQVKPDGTFAVSTFGGGDGAPAGDYVVTIEWRPLVHENGDVKAGPNVVPREYTRPESSPLRVTVKPGENALTPIEIAQAGPAAGPTRRIGED